MYCYKVKHGFLKVKSLKQDANLVNAGIEKYGFIPTFEKFEDEHIEWTNIWVKPIKIKYDSSIGIWAKKNLENIYKSDENWKNKLVEEGYEFDENGLLIENEKAKEDIDGQLVVSSYLLGGDMSGVLYINVSGSVEFFNITTLEEVAKNDIEALLLDKVIYKKKIKQ